MNYSPLLVYARMFFVQRVVQYMVQGKAPEVCSAWQSCDLFASYQSLLHAHAINSNQYPLSTHFDGWWSCPAKHNNRVKCNFSLTKVYGLLRTYLPVP